MQINENKILNEIPIAVIFFNKNFEIEFINEIFNSFNISEQLASMHIGKDIRKTDFVDEQFVELIQNIRETPFEIELNFTKKRSGKLLSIVVKGIPIYEKNQFIGGILVIEDIVTNEENEHENLIRTRFFSLLMKSFFEHFALFDSNWNILFQPKIDIELASKFDFEAAMNFAVKYISKTLDNFGKILFHDQTNQKFLEIGFSNFKLLKMKNSFTFIVFRDVTEEKHKLLAEEKRLKSIGDNILGGNLFLVLNENFFVTDFNSGNEELRKYLQIEKGTLITDIFGEEINNSINLLISQDFLSVNYELKRKKLTKYLQLIFVKEEGQSNNILLLVKDNTEELKLVNENLELKTNFQKVINEISDVFFEIEIVEGKLRLTSVTENVKNILGNVTTSEMNSPFFWYKIIHPNDRKHFFDELRKSFTNKSKKKFELDFKVISRKNQILNLRLLFELNRNEEGKIISAKGKMSDISSLVFEKEEISKQVLRLEELNQAKDRFISIISHDLRTPFSSILGFTDLMLSEDDIPLDKQKEYIKFIQNSSQSMLNLLNSLLDWTRLQTGRIQFAATKLNLKNVIANSVNILQGTAIQKGISLSFSLDSDIFVHADENLIAQIFGNLLGNALKFTRAGDSILVTAKQKINSNFIEISVKDSGVGIRKEDISKLFKVDSKFTNLGTAGEKGTGLGLSLVYEMIKKHGGDIRVESEFGKGTEFIFTLPTSSTNIMLVDNNTTDALLYSKLIRSLFPDFKVTVCSNKSEVEENLITTSPIVILSEIEIADFSVYDLSEMLNKLNERFKTKIIVLTREKSQKKLNDLRSFNFYEIFSKPVDLSIFKQRISEAFRNN